MEDKAGKKMKKEIASCYVPNTVNNLYAYNVRRLLDEAGIKTVSVKKCIKNPMIFLKCQIFNFNWFEDTKSILDFYIKIVFVNILKIFKKKIIFTIHNKKPHNIKNVGLSYKMMRYMCRKSDMIIGHCTETREIILQICKEDCKKLSIIPHPNYIANYTIKIDDYRNRYGLDNKDLVFLFFGFVSPYKNIEMILDIFGEMTFEHVKLLVVGKCSDLGYEDILKRKAFKKKNIVMDFRYVPDHEVGAVYATSDIVILPYHKDSSLNSGAAILSFSLRKSIICPKIGMIKDISDQSILNTYDYKDETEHLIELKKCILKICHQFKEDPSSIERQGIKAYRYVKEFHSDRIVKDAYKKSYHRLID